MVLGLQRVEVEVVDDVEAGHDDEDGEAKSPTFGPDEDDDV